MGICDVCGNEYQSTFTLTTAQDITYTFDSFECAIHQVAPTCAHCGCTVIGHGIQDHDQVYCCAHCAEARGVHGVSDNAEHVARGSGEPSRPGSPMPPSTGETVPPGAVPPGTMPPEDIPPGAVPPRPAPPLGT